LKALKSYSNVDSPHREKALQVYQELRKNIIDNMVTNYETTGYIWEQYNDKTGKGQGIYGNILNILIK
jgi:mannosyl-oligosaccharide glucosidase